MKKVISLTLSALVASLFLACSSNEFKPTNDFEKKAVKEGKTSNPSAVFLSYEFVENELKSQKKLRECLELNEESAVLIYTDTADNYRFLEYEIAKEDSEYTKIKKGDIQRVMVGTTDFIEKYKEKCGLIEPN